MSDFQYRGYTMRQLDEMIDRDKQLQAHISGGLPPIPAQQPVHTAEDEDVFLRRVLRNQLVTCVMSFPAYRTEIAKLDKEKMLRSFLQMGMSGKIDGPLVSFEKEQEEDE